MKPDSNSQHATRSASKPRRRLLIAAIAVTFCSCQTMSAPTSDPHSLAGSPANGAATQAAAPVAAPGPSMQAPPSYSVYDAQPVNYEQAYGPSGVVAAAPSPAALPPQAWNGAPAASPSCCPPGVSGGYPGMVGAPLADQDSIWRPPGLAGPWPTDEYICDGGDRRGSVAVAKDWTLYGLDPEDTVAHYDTLDGQRQVQPSNQVCIYAPRFAAVRRVTSVLQHEQHQRNAGLDMPLGPGLSGSASIPTTMLQPVQPQGQRAVKFGQAFRERTRGVGLENLQNVAETDMRWLPYEDLQIIRDGRFDNSEKARLSIRLESAVAWTHEKGVQVVVDNVAAVESSNRVESQSVYTYEMPPGKPRVRVVKIASKQDARPGEIIEFTLRFDNIGDQTVGNVTVIDNLMSRLEYVPDSQECSVEAEFVEQDNEADSLTLRWEVTEPLEVGQGGIIRFQCRVR